ncbi:secretory carrier-associated membrane protein 1-like protein [Tanacetum coccineum]
MNPLTTGTKLVMFHNHGDHFRYKKIFYIIGFAFFALESAMSIWVIQQVYMYFRGSGKAAEMKREAAKSTMMAAF